MYNINVPQKQELPSTGQLIKSTIIAAVVAMVLLVTVVMPAEYGIDPTGVGSTIGLKRMGEIKSSLAEDAKIDATKEEQSVLIVEGKVEEIVFQTETVMPSMQHKMSVTLAPDEGAEIKVSMKKGSAVYYEWWTDGGKANFDVHGDSKELKINYHNYSRGSAVRSNGDLVADFDGYHGWFWRNRTKTPLTVTIKTNGEYTSINRY